MKYSLRQLQVFLAVAQDESLTLAAKRLHMSQSAVSEAILNLERAYELRLFDRAANRLSLSSAGAAIRAEAENLYTQCSRFEEVLARQDTLGHIKVGASYTIGNHLATRYLSRYLQNYPDADIQLEISSSPDIVDKVLNFEVDIGMIEGQMKRPNLSLIPWMEDELIVFCAPDHPLAGKGRLSVADIAGARWILREPGSGARTTFERVMGKKLEHVNVFLEFRHNEAIQDAVQSGLGIGCLSQIVLEKKIAGGELVPLALPTRKIRRTFCLALQKERVQRPNVAHWISICMAGV